MTDSFSEKCCKCGLELRGSEYGQDFIIRCSRCGADNPVSDAERENNERVRKALGLGEFAKTDSRNAV